jgi:5'-nucleotidase
MTIKRSHLAILAIVVAILGRGPAAAQSGAAQPAEIQAAGEAQPAFDDPAAPRSRSPLTILQLNDVYSIAPINGVGGLARVATLKKRLAAPGRTPLLVLSGDFLSSSVASTVFKGEQMIAALNAAGLDVASLGNHEFDFGLDVLLQRMAEAKWQWVVSNVIDARTGRPVGDAAPFVVRTVGPLRVGFIGLCITTEIVRRDSLARVQFVDPFEAAARYVPILKAQQVDAIVALTHLNYEDDRALAERFPDIDLIVGGHEHFPIVSTAGRTLISKSGSDAKFVARIDLNKSRTGILERFFELVPVNSSIAEDADTAAVVNSYESRLGSEMERVVATARVPLNGVAIQLRSGETNLGSFVADALRANVDADIAMMNGGGIRGDRVYSSGPLTRRTLLEMHPFGNIVCKVEVPGRIVAEALNYGVSRLPAAAGQFPQVSGLTFRVDAAAPAGSRVRDILVNGRPLDDDRPYTLAIPDFMLLGGDGYTVFSGQRVLVSPEAGDLIVTALEKYAGSIDVAPSVEGRIIISQ